MPSLLEAAVAVGPAAVAETKISLSGQSVTTIDGHDDKVRVMLLANNNITSLKGLEGYKEIRVLRLEGNYIRSLREIEHLSELAHVTNICMRGNPICRHPLYRSTVLRILSSKNKVLRLDSELVEAADMEDVDSAKLLSNLYIPQMLWYHRMKESIEAEGASRIQPASWRHPKPVLKPPQGSSRATNLLLIMSECFSPPDDAGCTRAVVLTCGRSVLFASPEMFQSKDIESFSNKLKRYVMSHPTLVTGSGFDSLTARDFLLACDPVVNNMLFSMLVNCHTALIRAAEFRAAAVLTPPPTADISASLNKLALNQFPAVSSPPVPVATRQPVVIPDIWAHSIAKRSPSTPPKQEQVLQPSAMSPTQYVQSSSHCIPPKNVDVSPIRYPQDSPEQSATPKVTGLPLNTTHTQYLQDLSRADRPSPSLRRRRYMGAPLMDMEKKAAELPAVEKKEVAIVDDKEAVRCIETHSKEVSLSVVHQSCEVHMVKTPQVFCLRKLVTTITPPKEKPRYTYTTRIGTIGLEHPDSPSSSIAEGEWLEDPTPVRVAPVRVTPDLNQSQVEEGNWLEESEPDMELEASQSSQEDPAPSTAGTRDVQGTPRHEEADTSLATTHNAEGSCTATPSVPTPTGSQLRVLDTSQGTSVLATPPQPLQVEPPTPEVVCSPAPLVLPENIPSAAISASTPENVETKKMETDLESQKLGGSSLDSIIPLEADTVQHGAAPEKAAGVPEDLSHREAKVTEDTSEHLPEAKVAKDASENLLEAKVTEDTSDHLSAGEPERLLRTYPGLSAHPAEGMLSEHLKQPPEHDLTKSLLSSMSADSIGVRNSMGRVLTPTPTPTSTPTPTPTPTPDVLFRPRWHDLRPEEPRISPEAERTPLSVTPAKVEETGAPVFEDERLDSTYSIAETVEGTDTAVPLGGKMCEEDTRHYDDEEDAEHIEEAHELTQPDSTVVSTDEANEKHCEASPPVPRQHCGVQLPHKVEPLDTRDAELDLPHRRSTSFSSSEQQKQKRKKDEERLDGQYEQPTTQTEEELVDLGSSHSVHTKASSSAQPRSTPAPALVHNYSGFSEVHFDPGIDRISRSGSNQSLDSSRSSFGGQNISSSTCEDEVPMATPQWGRMRLLPHDEHCVMTPLPSRLRMDTHVKKERKQPRGLLYRFWQRLEGEDPSLVLVKEEAREAVRRGLLAQGVSGDDADDIIMAEEKAMEGALHSRYRRDRYDTGLELSVVEAYQRMRDKSKDETRAVLLETEMASVRSSLVAGARNVQTVAMKTMNTTLRVATTTPSSSSSTATPTVDKTRRTKKKKASFDSSLLSILDNLTDAGITSKRDSTRHAEKRVRLLIMCRFFTTWKRSWSARVLKKATAAAAPPRRRRIIM